MALVTLIHGAFNELWGPHELQARWTPALQDGLWHHDHSLDPADVAVCFYGDLFRLDPEAIDVEEWETSRAGTEELLAGLGGPGGLEMLEQAAGKATFDRTVDMVTIMNGDPTLAETARGRLLDRIGPDTRAVVAHSLGTIVAYNTLRRTPRSSSTRSSRSDHPWAQT